MKRFAVTGPESSGKTTLAIALAEQYAGTFIPEFARAYLEQKNGIYAREDLDRIAEKQMALWEEISAEKLLFCDTEMLVLKIWSEFKYGTCSTFILEAFRNQQFEHYFLCRPDIDWEEDPLRENPEDREELFERYLSQLKKQQIPFTIVEGTLENRINMCADIITK
jgi:NadR type nicotinamide-nucleotide adenylyltransferase